MYYKSGGPFEEMIRIGQLYFFGKDHGKDKMEELVLSGQSKGEKTREDTQHQNSFS